MRWYIMHYPAIEPERDPTRGGDLYVAQSKYSAFYIAKKLEQWNRFSHDKPHLTVSPGIYTTQNVMPIQPLPD